jgi:iron complex transport system substrate-binding protein
MLMSHRDGSSIRRALLLVAALLMAVGLLSACGSDDESSGGSGSSSADSVSGPFTFTDDLGNTVELPEKPKRIVVQSSIGAALWDLGVRPIGVFGPQKLADGSQDPQSGHLDLSTMTSVGEAYGDFSVEEFLTLDADLVITTVYSDLLWYIPEEAQPKIGAKTPIIGVKLEAVDIAAGIDKLKELVTALGLDVETAEIKADQAEFESASETFSKAVAANKDLKVVPVSGFADNFYVGDPTYLGGLKLFVNLGLELPAANGDGGAYEELSWEQVGTYPADVFFQDSRDPANVAVFDDKATWNALPAVQAGQVYPWNPETPYSYSLYAEELERFAKVIDDAKSGLVP